MLKEVIALLPEAKKFNLKFSIGWMEQFKKRFDLKFCRVHGEAGSAENNAVVIICPIVAHHLHVRV